MTTATPLNVAAKDYLIRGSEYIAAHYPDFSLKGRSQELFDMADILLRKGANNLLLTGESGVGLTAMSLGLQSSKEHPDTPLDIVAKRFFWIESDELFASGDTQKINESFQKIRQTLSRSPDSILVIESAADFINSARNAGCGHLVNGLFADLRTGKYQAILETPTKHLTTVLESDNDFLEHFTVKEIKEPKPKELREIAAHGAENLAKYHGIAISPEAIEAAVMLTEKYRLQEFRAQPDASIALLDRALSSFRNSVHRRPLNLQILDKEIATLQVNGKTSADLNEKLEALKAAESAWEETQKTLRLLHKEQRGGEEAIRKLEKEIEEIQKKDSEQTAKEDAQLQTSATAPKSKAPAGGFVTGENPEITALRGQIKVYEGAVEKGRDQYKKITAEVNKDLKLMPEHIMLEFSHISGIPASKLNEDEREKLQSLDENLAKRVMGQEEPVRELANAVRRARMGLRMADKPQANFLFLGPSGVGKTELAKALAQNLNGDERSLLRFDMSEYMEEHAVSKLIGAPPGYEGYAAGGILTNAVRRNPHSIILFDEIEKAHPKVFDLMLQVLGDARLTDSRGLTANFSETIILMTTNIGTKHFLNPDMKHEEAKHLAEAELLETYRPEFIGRFNGNIYCFKRLDMDTLKMIVEKDLKRINGLLAPKGVSLTMPAEDIHNMLEDHHDAKKGARSILGYIDRAITSGIANEFYARPGLSGNVIVKYDSALKKPVLTMPEGAAVSGGAAKPQGMG